MAAPHVQLVHSTGVTRVHHATKSANIDRLFTCGDDFLVRLLPTSQLTESEGKLFEESTGIVTWMDSNSTHLVTSSEDGAARLYSHSPPQFVNILSRGSLPSRCVAIEPSPQSGKSPRVAIVGDELTIKLVDIEDVHKSQIIGGHSKAIRSVSWSPIKPILVSTACDGSVKVWDLSESETKLLKEIDGVLKSYRPENEFSTNAVWHPSGSYFVLPSKTNEIICISSTSWTKSSTFNNQPDAKDGIESPNGEISFMSFSPNGRYLAASTSDSQVTIWETSSQKPVKSKKSDSLVTGISWNPIKDDLAWTDDAGQLTRWENVVGKDRPSSFEPVNHGSTSTNRTMVRDEVDDLFEGTGLDDDDDMAAAAAFADVEAGEDKERNVREKSTSRREKRAGTFDDEEDLDDFIEDDDNGENHHRRAKPASTKFSSSSSRAPSRFPTLSSSTKSQPPFQSGSTQSTSNPSRRFLSFNQFGTLISVEAEGHHVVQFDSFDVSTRRNFRINDYSGYTMANLGASGALFACPSGTTASNQVFGGDESSNGNASIFFKPFENAGWSGGQSDEWTISLPKGEDPIALALGGVGVTRDDEESSDSNSSLTSSKGISALVATSEGYLRTFSPSGLQRNVIDLTEPVVTISAGKYTAMIVTRKAAAFDGYQNLSYTLLDLSTSRVRSRGDLPLLKKDVTLTWTGFNELDTPLIFDSCGTLHVLNGLGNNGHWMTVLDTRKLASVNSGLNYWPVSVSGNKLDCLILRGAKAPDASSQSRPLIQELDFVLPVCSRGGNASIDAETEGEDGESKPKPLSGLGLHEETYLRESLFSDLLKNSRAPRDSDSLRANQQQSRSAGASSDRALLLLIPASVKSDKYSRALEATSLLNEVKHLDAAIKIAHHFNAISLAERMEEFREAIERKEESRAREEKKRMNLLLSFELEEAEEVEPQDDSWMRTKVQNRGSRILAPPSQESNFSHGFSTNGQITSKKARMEASKALGEKFDHNPNKRSLGMGLSKNGLLNGMPPPDTTTTNRKSGGIDWPDSSNATFDSPSPEKSGNNDEQEEDSMDLDRQVEADNRKRKSTSLDDDDGDSLANKPVKKTSNPFAQTKPNPFARNSSGNQNSNGVGGAPERKRSMHKSQSFFDRVDAVDKEKPMGGKKKSNATEKISTSVIGNGKQSKLTFGKKKPDVKAAQEKEMDQDDVEEGNENGKERETTQIGFGKAKISDAFVETQDLLSEESQDRLENQEAEISLTLKKANEKERRGQVLEETQVERRRFSSFG